MPSFLPTTHPLFLALELAQDQARGREALAQWTPDDPKDLVTVESEPEAAEILADAHDVDRRGLRIGEVKVDLIVTSALTDGDLAGLEDGLASSSLRTAGPSKTPSCHR